MTVAEALSRAARRLDEAGVSSAPHDAEALLRHVLGWDRARVVVEGGAPLDPESETSFFALVDERAARRPLQHLTGRTWFWRQELLVSPDVLVPRPETEVLVEAALEALRGVERPLVADVGTGSGCIALAIASERPDAEVHATDLSPAALGVARDNARRLQLDHRVRFHEGDLLAPLVASFGRFALVASNPPYVGIEEAPALPPEVRDHEPPLALFPPGDRLSVYRRLAPQAASALRPGGVLVVEVGAGMAAEVAAVAQAAGLRLARTIPDLAGIPRTVVALRPVE